MKSIRIENLRSLQDTGNVVLRPVTLLVGHNSSGKSTFLRFFPLLRQGAEIRTTGPVLWFGRFVDFGSFTDAINKHSKSKQIVFHFHFSIGNDWEMLNGYMPINFSSQIEDAELQVRLALEGGPKIEDTLVRTIELRIGEHLVLLDLTSAGRVEKLTINSRELTSGAGNSHIVQRRGLIPSLVEDLPSDSTSKMVPRKSRSRSFSFAQAVINEIKKLVHANTHNDTIIALAEKLSIGSSRAMLAIMKSLPNSTEMWRRNVSNWTTANNNFQLIRDLVIARAIPDILDMSNNYLTQYVHNITYVAPLRATAERYYRLQGLAVDEVDFQGQNMAMFLRNMSSRDREKFTVWMLEHFGFAPQTHFDGGHISIRITESNTEGASYNLADMGFGFSQILPIVTQLWVLAYQRQSYSRRNYRVPITFAIEQPELHLHPRIQAKLADAIISTIKAAKDLRIDLRLLIETHSETIVNRLGYQIANGKIDHDDIGIVLFEKHTPTNSTQVSFGKYDADGFLENWPFGFFEV